MAKLHLKKGCVKKGLIVLVVIVTTIIIALIIIANTLGGNTEDARLKELLNRDYSISFTDKITETQTQSTKTLLTENLILSNGSSIITNGDIDIDKLFSNDVRIKNSFEMTGYDFAVFANFILSLTASNDNKIYSNLLKIIDFTMQSVDTSNTTLINYRATFKIDLNNLSSSNELPSNIYVTIDATVDSKLSIDKMLINHSIQINRLTGDDNTYAVNAIKEMFNFSNDDLVSIAKAPIDLLVERSKIWGASFKIVGSNFVFTKN